MSQSEPERRKELVRITRVADQMCSAHAHLRDRHTFRALALDIGVLGLSTWTVALVFVDPAINARLTPPGFEPLIWVGLLSIGTFFLSLLQLRLDLKGRAEAHRRSMRLFADVKALVGAALKRGTDITSPEYQRLSERYALANELAAEVPERDFLESKQRHVIKVAMSRHLDAHPYASKTLTFLKGVLRDNLRPKGESMAKKAKAVEHYRRARRAIDASPWAHEVEHQTKLRSGRILQRDFLREYAWVVLNSGFKESVIRAKFNYILLCFHDWSAARDIARSAAVCVATAASAFNNKRKLNGIAAGAALIAKEGYRNFLRRMRADPIAVLQELPFIGPITVWHLAKNLGFPVAKPDRHLERLSAQFGFAGTHAMCSAISEVTGDRPDVIDAVLWRVAAEKQLQSQMGGLAL